jgi:hypothetical protein
VLNRLAPDHAPRGSFLHVGATRARRREPACIRSLTTTTSPRRELVIAFWLCGRLRSYPIEARIFVASTVQELRQHTRIIKTKREVGIRIIAIRGRRARGAATRPAFTEARHSIPRRCRIGDPFAFWDSHICRVTTRRRWCDMSARRVIERRFKKRIRQDSAIANETGEPGRPGVLISEYSSLLR